MANVERLRHLAEVLRTKEHIAPPEDPDIKYENLPIGEEAEGFNLTVWHCKTVACICGWAITEYHDEVPMPRNAKAVGGGEINYAIWGEKILGLTPNQGGELFLPYLESTNSKKLMLEDEVPPALAANVLDAIAEEAEGGHRLTGKKIERIWEREAIAWGEQHG